MNATPSDRKKTNNDDDNGSGDDKGNNKSWLRFGINSGIILAIAACVFYLGYLAMCATGLGFYNARTPAGYMGYVTQGSVFSNSRFVEVQGEDGPTSTGMGWLYSVVNVSVTPYTMQEKFEGNEGVQSGDSTLVEFEINVKWRVRPKNAHVKRFIEEFATLDHKDHPDKIVEVAYNNYLKQPMRNAARQQVEKIGPLAIKDQIGDIGHKLKALLVEIAKDTPFEILDVTFGFLHYPDRVTDAVADTIASKQLLLQKDTEIAIQEQERLKRVIEAEGLAEAMKIIQSKLTLRYLQYEAIEVQALTVDSPNTTTMIIPVGPLGLPILDVNQLRLPAPGPVPPTPKPEK